MLTALLTEGPRVTGAVGLATRTGELLVVRQGHGAGHRAPGPALAVLHGATAPPSATPTAPATGWPRPGTPGPGSRCLEESFPDSGPLAYLAYGVGNAHNSWHGCPIVDARGREVPWVDRDGRELAAAAERFRPSPGQPFMLGHGQRVPETRANRTARLAPDLPERIRRGEFVLPLYADLSRLRACRAPGDLRPDGRQRGQDPHPGLPDAHPGRLRPGARPAAGALPGAGGLRPRQLLGRDAGAALAAVGLRGPGGGLGPAHQPGGAVRGRRGRVRRRGALQRRGQRALCGQEGRGRGPRGARPGQVDAGQVQAEKKRLYAPLWPPGARHRLEGAERGHLPGHAGPLRADQERGRP